MKIAAIFRSRVANTFGPYLVFYPTHPASAIETAKARRAPTAPNNEELQLSMIKLIEGVNFIEKEQYDLMMQHPRAKADWTAKERRGAIAVYQPTVPEGEYPTDTTADYPDLGDVQDIIQNCFDSEWLRLCIAKDNRPGISQWCYTRIQEIEDSRRRRRENPVTMNPEQLVRA